MSDIVERLQTFNSGRDPALLQAKYTAMRSNAFAFYRGTCHLFYQDWPAQSPLNEAPLVWICGDLHWQNLGSYKGDNRLVYFNLNDFDEAVLAPCTWDLARFLVSLLVGAPILEMKESAVLDLCQYFLAQYTKELARGRARTFEENQTTGIVHDLLFQVRVRNRAAFLDSRTAHSATGRTLLVDGKRAIPATDSERAAVAQMLTRWAAQRPDPAFFTVLDVARRIAGIGSLGVERYVVLVEGKGSPNQNYLLDLKAATMSSLQSYLTHAQPHWHNEAERVVTIQHWIQDVPPALLVSVPLIDRFYVLRELQPSEDKINTELVRGKAQRLEKLIKAIAKVVAWGQTRSAGRQGATTAYDLMDFAHKSSWPAALLDYARSYSAHVNHDYQDFSSAYDLGAFKPIPALTQD